MSEVTIEPASSARFDDVQHTFDQGGDGRSCQCQWWTLTSREFEGKPRDSLRGLLEHEVAQSPPPGLIAYVDGEAAAWVRVGPRTVQARLSRTRAFKGSVEPWDDADVWAVTCFVVRRDHRGAGLNAALLTAAVNFARDNGARVIEGYPIDTDTSDRGSNALFTGVLSTFLAAGFDVVARTPPDRVIVSRELT